MREFHKSWTKTEHCRKKRDKKLRGAVHKVAVTVSQETTKVDKLKRSIIGISPYVIQSVVNAVIDRAIQWF